MITFHPETTAANQFRSWDVSHRCNRQIPFTQPNASCPSHHLIARTVRLGWSSHFITISKSQKQTAVQGRQNFQMALEVCTVTLSKVTGDRAAAKPCHLGPQLLRTLLLPRLQLHCGHVEGNGFFCVWFEWIFRVLTKQHVMALYSWSLEIAEYSNTHMPSIFLYSRVLNSRLLKFFSIFLNNDASSDIL